MEWHVRCLVALWLYRYLRFVVHCISHWTFRPIPLPAAPSLFASDVTVIIPTIEGEGIEFERTVSTTLATQPAQLILVTIDKNLKRVAEWAARRSDKILVLSEQFANKRRQICQALPLVQTAITVLADDDVIWPPKILEWMLAAFERPDIGGVGTSQRLLRAQQPNWWGFLAALYLERRNFEISATTHIDGGLSCLSGRTVAYRSDILRSREFIEDFQNEKWVNKYQLNTDDDNFITRWMVSHNWKTYVQYCREAELQTTLEDNPRFLRQCLRWSRSNWRSNITSMFVEKHIWTQQPWSSYALHIATFTNWAFAVDSLMLYLAYNSFGSQALAAMSCWIVLTKFVKTFGHFVRYPADIALLPVSIFFGYMHGLIKLYALCTLDVTTWGSRDGADEADEHRMKKLVPMLHELDSYTDDTSGLYLPDYKTILEALDKDIRAADILDDPPPYTEVASLDHELLQKLVERGPVSPKLISHSRHVASHEHSNHSAKRRLYHRTGRLTAGSRCAPRRGLWRSDRIGFLLHRK